ncbi:MAG: hypothetical protein EPN17_00685 [Methylobacter sp.]|nr:MAG: hypothetical protein EPN17_00685 [Methylobacter sp.]
MNVPNNVFQAVIAIWASLIIGVIIMLFEQKLGIIAYNQLVGILIMYGLFSILPYKIFNGSNACRYIFTVLTVIGFFMMAAYEEEPIPKGEIILSIIEIPLNILSIIEIPLEIFIIYKLFTQESNLYFSRA